jgi:hypothetical protein
MKASDVFQAFMTGFTRSPRVFASDALGIYSWFKRLARRKPD